MFLDALGQQLPGERVGRVWDGSGAHQPTMLVWPDGLVPLALPPYSPQLNPVERIFEHRRAKLANRLFGDLTELEEAMTQHLQGFWAESTALRQLTGYSWWLAGLETIQASSPTRRTKEAGIQMHRATDRGRAPASRGWHPGG